MRERHWAELLEIAQKDFQMSADTKLSDVEQLNLLAFQMSVEEIADKVSRKGHAVMGITNIGSRPRPQKSMAVDTLLLLHVRSPERHSLRQTRRRGPVEEMGLIC